MALSSEELLRRIQVLEKSQAAKSSFVAVKTVDVTPGTVTILQSGTEALSSIGFVKMTVEGKVVYVPAFGKVE